ncbi:hypothetical protein GCM10010123_44070 [Pilimelia anulata]|uniref:Uncharacterized protein n=2 Tax=Pilimelia anulata TaxID=53371 RepID=A0A8J3BH69_9ACTN|nr:hypothetical protein GCM10010123_44070 [Pilimelia anulata]
MTVDGPNRHAPHMAWTLERPDPDRHRRRLKLLAELAGARSVRDLPAPRRVRASRVNNLIAARRRLVG